MKPYVDCGIVSFRMEKRQLDFVRAAAKRMGLGMSEMFRVSALSVAASNGDDAPEHSYTRGRPKKRKSAGVAK